MNFPVNVPKETWKRKWVMIVKSCFCSLLLRSMLHVQKSTIPELWIFHWNFTVCMWLQPEGCTETSVYDASQQNKLQHGLNLIPRSPYATQLYLCLNVFTPISQIYDNPSRSTWENVNSATFSLRNVGITWNCVKVKMCKYFVVLGSSAGEATPTGPEWKSTNETAFWKIFTVDWHLSCSSCRFVAPSPAQVQLQPVLLAQTGLKGTGDTRGSPSQGTSVPNDDPENPSHTHTRAHLCILRVHPSSCHTVLRSGNHSKGCGFVSLTCSWRRCRSWPLRSGLREVGGATSGPSRNSVQKLPERGPNSPASAPSAL